jgi:hypothetical protein
MFQIKMFLIVFLLIYTGYFRGWNGWCFTPLVLFLLVMLFIQEGLGVNITHLSGWIRTPIQVGVFWLPTIVMAVVGKSGREDFEKWMVDVWAWIQDQRQ